jgi:cysteine desulfurase family protein (TIGR01976 family)
MTSDLVTYDVARVRPHFPALADRTAYFDGPGGTQTPDAVAEAVARTMTQPLSNRGDLSVAEANADAVVRACRDAVGDLLGADPSGVIFGRSMTELTFHLARAMAKDWAPGDEVVVSRLDHDANVRPWVLAAESVGATLRWLEFDPATGELPVEAVAAVVTERTRLVAVTAASNLIGTIPDLPTIAEAVHAVGGWLYVDGVHRTAHDRVDMAAWGTDFYGCSAYKFLGPHCAVVAGRPELLEKLSPDKLAPATDEVPERFELGTLPYELMAGTTAAIDFLADLVPGDDSGDRGRPARLDRSLRSLHAHEERLRTRIENAVSELPGVTCWSRASRRTPTLLLTFADRDADSVARSLADRGVNAPAGSFYAYEPALVLGLGEAGGLRIGLAPYTDDEDVDRLLDGLSTTLG